MIVYALLCSNFIYIQKFQFSFNRCCFCCCFLFFLRTMLSKILKQLSCKLIHPQNAHFASMHNLVRQLSAWYLIAANDRYELISYINWSWGVKLTWRRLKCFPNWQMHTFTSKIHWKQTRLLNLRAFACIMNGIFWRNFHSSHTHTYTFLCKVRNCNYKRSMEGTNDSLRCFFFASLLLSLLSMSS